MESRSLTPGKPSHGVQIVSSTWARDEARGLLNFEAKANELHKKTLTANRSMKLVRTGTDVQMVGLHDTLPSDCDHLLNLVETDGKFFVDRASGYENRPWYVVRSVGQLPLREGDTIKLGRFKLRVRQMVASESSGAQTELRQDEMEQPRTKAPFIALENMTSDENGAGRGSVHVISLADNKLLTLGRSQQNDVCIADVSVSRSHATISFHGGKFVLKDNKSRFGTLVAMKKPLKLGEFIGIQVGRTVLNLQAVSPVVGESNLEQLSSSSVLAEARSESEIE